MDVRIRGVILVGAALLLGGCSGGAMKSLGLHNGRLQPCPASPNCVCSMDSGRPSSIAPFRYDTDSNEAGQALRNVLMQEQNATIIQEEPEYLHVEFRSQLFGFVDDVELYLPPGKQQVEVRSASRTGWWDMGENRKRIERLRQLFSKAVNG